MQPDRAYGMGATSIRTKIPLANVSESDKRKNHVEPFWILSFLVWGSRY